jgi:hypothetical protein
VNLNGLQCITREKASLNGLVLRLKPYSMASEPSDEIPLIFKNSFGFRQVNHHFSKRSQYLVDRNQHFGERNYANWDPSPFQLCMVLCLFQIK